MATVLGCIADNFTGATDLAGLLARAGARASPRIGVPASEPADTAQFEVIALKIRTESAAVAVEKASTTFDWLRQAGAQRFFWKYCSTFDSTAEGNIGPVAEALITKLGAYQNIYCPAFPENGRTIFMGNLVVGREPLAERPMKDHPLTPMRGSNLKRLLEPQVGLPVGLAECHTVANGADVLREELAMLPSNGVAHVVVDATGKLISGDRPTNEVPLHIAFYEARSTAGAVVHLHSRHAVALSMMPDVDPEDIQPAFTPCAIMKLGRVKLLPFLLRMTRRWVRLSGILLENGRQLCLPIMELWSSARTLRLPVTLSRNSKTQHGWRC